MAAAASARRRVVVTGTGLVTSLGLGTDTVWNRLLEGVCGVDRLPDNGYEVIPCKVIARVPQGEGPDQFNRQRYVPKSLDQAASLSAAFTLAAAQEALAMADWAPQQQQQLERTGVSIGDSGVSMSTILAVNDHLLDSKYKKISPYTVPRVLANIPAGLVTLTYGFQGPNHAVTTACATGLHAIGDASRFIRHGDADVMVAGGTEACIHPVTLAAMGRLKALATRFNDRPGEASRPFDSQRDGFVMSEGAGLMVLEELSHAQQRGATILGEILGYGLSGDAHHVTSPSGEGIRRSMLAALKDAGIDSGHVGHVNAHATSTLQGDVVESRAIMKVLGRAALVTSTKGHLGHSMAATGSVEAIMALRSCQTGLVPHTLNLSKPDTGYDLNYVMDRPRPWPRPSNGRRVALTNSSGFGSTNGSLCVAEFLSQ